ncbi:YeiH family protein [Nonomuraea sp. NPDC050783]|uniref:YeiH family protein n=1 Tax=Nonomuraea sp. NPDC050783 TaxID=3154634 RepID=UPI0034674A33
MLTGDHPRARLPAALPAVLPGVALAAVAVVPALVVNHFVPALSPAVVAVACGAALANLAAVPARFGPGLAFVSRRVLRVAIALLGLRIVVPDVLALGWRTLAVVAVATGVTFLVTPRVGRALGLTPGTSLLVAAGVSICGASAVAAMRDSVPACDDDDAANALGVVVLYGTAAIVVLPALASLLRLPPDRLAVWAGAAVHEVAQVAAIGAAAGGLATAVTVKLARVVLLAPMVALAAHRRPSPDAERGRPGDDEPGRPRDDEPGRPRDDGPLAGPAVRPHVRSQVQSQGRPPARSHVRPHVRPQGRPQGRPPVVPLFVAAFLAMAALRSTGLVPEAVTAAVPQVTGVLTAAALFALGTGIDVRKLARGGRTLLLGGFASALVAGLSLAGVTLLV